MFKLTDAQTLESAFSYQYNGQPGAVVTPTAVVNGDGDKTVYTFDLLPQLRVTRSVTRYPAHNAVWIETELSNPAPTRSGVIAEFCDLDCRLPLLCEPPATAPMLSPSPETPAVTRMLGTTWDIHEFESKTDVLTDGQKLAVQPERGASSERSAPFFNLHQVGSGLMLAIGWTGQHKTVFERRDGEIRLTVGIADTAYYLLPGEKLRTASALLLFYEGEPRVGQNALRRLLREEFSPRDRMTDGENAPFCFSFWGGLPSDEMLRRLPMITGENLGFDTCWIDAGWYGCDPKPCDSENDGWYAQSGNWYVNTDAQYHPDGLKEVSRAVHEAGLKLLLWFHPEISNKGSDLSLAHPEWMYSPSASRFNDFVNLGNPEAEAWLTQRIGDLIEQIGVDCYRQDFCYFPLTTWNDNDRPDRKGISQIKHINALYRLWDALLARFPKLLIDNCSGGGRRLDIEMMRRSVPLWRSDLQCTGDCDPEIAQCNAQGLNAWLPYCGTGTGAVIDDLYRLRSCYAPALSIGHWNYRFTSFEGDENRLPVLRKACAEYRRVQPYLSRDYYPLTECGAEGDSWAVWQFDRPENGDGVVLAFRRKHSPFPTAELVLQGSAAVGGCVLTDADSGESRTVTDGKLTLTLPQKRSSAVLFYERA